MADVPARVSFAARDMVDACAVRKWIDDRKLGRNEKMMKGLKAWHQGCTRRYGWTAIPTIPNHSYNLHTPEYVTDSSGEDR